MLKNFWYACEWSAAVTNKPKSLKMLGQTFVLYRDSSDRVIALADRCPHRGASLALGWIENDCLRCPYHGWKFASDGQCVEIPSTGSAFSKVMTKAKVNTYPVQEKFGLVWLFYGDLPVERRPPIPPLPEYGDSEFQHISLDVQFNAHYTRVIENALCPAHLPTVHAKSFGAAFVDDQRVLPYQVENLPWGLTASIRYPKVTKPKGIFKFFFRSSYTEIKSRTTFYLPNITVVESDFIRGKMVNYAIHIPIDERTTVSKRMQFRNVFKHPW